MLFNFHGINIHFLNENAIKCLPCNYIFQVATEAAARDVL